MGLKDSVLFTKIELRSFCIYRFIFGVSYSLMIPIIPLFFNSIGMTTVSIGIVMSLFGISKMVAQIPFGVISDQIGDKLTIIIALAIMTCIPFMYTIIKTNTFSGLTYVIQGAILGMAAPATYSILARSVDSKRRGESTGIASAVFTFGGGIGAAIAGAIVTKFGNYNLVFYISSIGILFTLFYVSFKIPKATLIHAKVKYGNTKVKGKNKIRLLLEDIEKYKAKYKIIVLASIAFLGDFIYSCIVTLFHFYGQEVLGTSTSYTSSIISVYLIVFGLGAPLAGWVSDLIGNKKQLFLSFFIMNMSLLGLVLTRDINIFTVVIVVYFLGATFLNAALQSSLSEFGANPRIKGIVFGFVGASESLGYALGPIISAVIYNFNKSLLFLGLLIVSSLVSLLYILLHKKARI